jgi:ATP-dependent DNA helicase PIF1
LILAKVKSTRNIAIAVASYGITATLLKGGRTAHVIFKLPLNLITSVTSVCNILKQSNFMEDLKNTKIIVRNIMEWLRERAILTPKNDQPVSTNVTLLMSFERKEKVYTSI